MFNLNRNGPSAYASLSQGAVLVGCYNLNWVASVAV